MKLSTVLKAIGALFVLLVIGLGVFIATLDVNQYRGRIAAAIEDATGRTVTLDGDMDLAIGLSPALVVEDVSIGNTDWATDPEMVSVGRLEAQMALLPLLSGEIRVDRIVLVKAVVSLETNAEGAGNWALGALGAPGEAPGEDDEGSSTPSADSAGQEAAGPPMQVRVRDVRLEDATLVYRDGASGQTLRVALEKAALQGAGLDDPVTVDVAGVYNEAAFTLAGTLGPVAGLTAPDGPPWPLDLTATAGGATVTVKGTIAEPARVRGLDLAITAEGRRLSDLGALAKAAGQEVAVPALGPYRVAARLTGDVEALALSGLDATVGTAERLNVTASGAIADVLAQSGLDLAVTVKAPDPAVLADLGAAVPVPVQAEARVRDIAGGYRMEELTATLGRSSLTGRLDAVLNGPRPAVSGKIAASRLDLDELAGGAGSAPGSGDGAAAPSGPMIPDTPLPLDLLRLADADLSLSAATVVLPGGANLTDVTTGVRLAEGTLTVDPLRATVAEGAVSGRVGVRPVGGGAADVTLDLSGDAVSLGTLARTFGGSDALEGGATRLRVSLRGQGATPHAVAGTLNGSVLVHTVDARMNNGAVNWAGGDVFTQIGELINPFGNREPTTPIQCLVFSMTATNGVLANDHGIALETDRMVVGGGGAFDLGAERLNVRIAPRPRPGVGLETGLGRIVELFAVTGSFRKPGLELDAQKAVETGLRTAASAAGAVATGGLSLLGENLASNLLGGGGDGEMEPCLVALGEKEPGAVGSAHPETPAEAGQATEQQPAEAEQRPATPEGALGNVLRKGLGGLLGN